MGVIYVKFIFPHLLTNTEFRKEKCYKSYNKKLFSQMVKYEKSGWQPFQIIRGFLNLILETMINEHIRTFWTGLGDHTNSLTLFKFLNFRTLSFCTTRENYSIVFKTNDAQVQCFYEYIQALQLRFRIPLLHIVFTVANAIMHVSQTTISWHIFN